VGCANTRYLAPKKPPQQHNAPPVPGFVPVDWRPGLQIKGSSPTAADNNFGFRPHESSFREAGPNDPTTQLQWASGVGAPRCVAAGQAARQYSPDCERRQPSVTARSKPWTEPTPNRETLCLEPISVGCTVFRRTLSLAPSLAPSLTSSAQTSRAQIGKTARQREDRSDGFETTKQQQHARQDSNLQPLVPKEVPFELVKRAGCCETPLGALTYAAATNGAGFRIERRPSNQIQIFPGQQSMRKVRFDRVTIPFVLYTATCRRKTRLLSTKSNRVENACFEGPHDELSSTRTLERVYAR
jgi:hypothetical protein